MHAWLQNARFMQTTAKFMQNAKFCNSQSRFCQILRNSLDVTRFRDAPTDLRAPGAARRAWWRAWTRRRQSTHTHTASCWSCPCPGSTRPSWSMSLRPTRPVAAQCTHHLSPCLPRRVPAHLRCLVSIQLRSRLSIYQASTQNKNVLVNT